MSRNLHVVASAYGPHSAAGRIVAPLCEALSAHASVRVVAGGGRLSTREGSSVLVESVPANLSGSAVPIRLLSSLHLSFSLSRRVLRSARPGDTLLCFTSPPTLPFFAWAAARARGLRLGVVVHDLYPEVLEALGLLTVGGGASRGLHALSAWLYGRADVLIVLGEAARVRLHAKAPLARILVIPNGAARGPCPDTRDVARARAGLACAQFIVQYCGTMGRTHDVSIVLDAAERLAGRPDIGFQLIGRGALFSAIKERVTSHGRPQIQILSSVGNDELSSYLAGADVSVVSYRAGMAGVSYPSRLADVFSAGRPVIAVTDPGSDLETLISSQQLGLAVPCGDAGALASAIERLANDRHLTRQMGACAQAFANEHLGWDNIGRRYAEALWPSEIEDRGRRGKG